MRLNGDAERRLTKRKMEAKIPEKRKRDRKLRPGGGMRAKRRKKGGHERNGGCKMDYAAKNGKWRPKTDI